MVRPRLFDEETETVKVTLSASMLLQLKAIAMASPHGRVQRPDMLRKAVEEYIESRISDASVQAALASLRKESTLRLVPRAVNSTDDD